MQTAHGYLHLTKDRTKVQKKKAMLEARSNQERALNVHLPKGQLSLQTLSHSSDKVQVPWTAVQSLGVGAGRQGQKNFPEWQSARYLRSVE